MGEGKEGARFLTGGYGKKRTWPCQSEKESTQMVNVFNPFVLV